MQTTAATIIDVAREFQTRISSLPLASAFMLYDGARNILIFTTFFESIDHKAEERLADIEGDMIDSFSESQPRRFRS